MIKQKIFFAILLAVLPIISFILNYHYSVQSGTLENFKTTYALYYLDFLFIIFNALILCAVRINYKILGVTLVLCALILTFLNFTYWTFQRDVGIVHLIFAIIEMSLLITAIFSKTINRKAYLIMMIPIMIYFTGAFIIEAFINTPVVILETIPHLVGLIAVSLRLTKPKLFRV